MCRVRGRIFHELEVVHNALVWYCAWGEPKPLMCSSCIPVESTARLMVFPPEPATTSCMWPEMYVCLICVCTCKIIATDLEPIHPANQMASWGRVER